MIKVLPPALFLLAVALSVGAVHAQPVAEAPVEAAKIPDTLMFTIDELNDIQSRLSGAEGEEAGEDSGDVPENVSLHLSTILYYGPKDWTIWVNGVPISPGETFQAFQVTDIGPSFVELLVPLSAQGMRPVRLGPNQTFIAKSGVVVEGNQN